MMLVSLEVFPICVVTCYSRFELSRVDTDVAPIDHQIATATSLLHD